ncbi:MAG: DUF1016 N-terminal domain-containing protein [Methanoregula sp.]|nr:DUF1016 N-terminal domain-containing protein [Methanoregula sp.]
MKRKAAITAGKKTGAGMSPAPDDVTPSPALLTDLRSLIESARTRVAVGVNAELVMLHWHIGHRLRQDILDFGRGAYGERIIELVARDLMVAGAFQRRACIT